MYVIYALIDPRDNTVRYVGQTTDVYKRFMEHVNCSCSNYAKNAWIHGLRAANKMVIMETLEEVEGREKALEREAYWIQHFEMMQEPVMNVSKRSSARKAKKTNLRTGRNLSHELMKDTMLENAPVVKSVVTLDSHTAVLSELLRQAQRGCRTFSSFVHAMEGKVTELGLSQILAEIGKMKANGMSNDAILKEYGLTPGGRNNQNLKAVTEVISNLEVENW